MRVLRCPRLLSLVSDLRAPGADTYNGEEIPHIGYSRQVTHFETETSEERGIVGLQISIRQCGDVSILDLLGRSAQKEIQFIQPIVCLYLFLRFTHQGKQLSI